MIKRDSVIAGLIAGLVIPGAMFALLFVVNSQVEYRLRESTIFLIAVCANLVSVHYTIQKKALVMTGRGVILATFTLAIVYVIKYVV